MRRGLLPTHKLMGLWQLIWEDLGKGQITCQNTGLGIQNGHGKKKGSHFCERKIRWESLMPAFVKDSGILFRKRGRDSGLTAGIVPRNDPLPPGCTKLIKRRFQAHPSRPNSIRKWDGNLVLRQAKNVKRTLNSFRHLCVEKSLV